MEEKFQNNRIIEEKVEKMVSLTGGLQTSRKAHFIKPILSSTELPPLLELPCLNRKQECPLQVTFNGWPKTPTKKWRTWVETMHSKYSDVWEKAGILNAIMLSTLKIKRNDGFLFSLVENWCSDTNTFIFPWGEATVTLEDVMVLGGFPVLGDPVLSELEKDEKLVKIREYFEDGRKNLERLEKDEFNVDWLYFYMGCDCAYEHEAFLCLWLLTCVFPGCDDKLFGIVFDLAVWLGRGRRFALGPSVLASLYRDLGVLSGAMVGSNEGEDVGSSLVLTMWSPLYLVQVWAWERLPLLQPTPNVIGKDEARMKRWHGEKKGSRSVSESGVNSAGVSFLWRPYVIAVDGWSLPKFYLEEEMLLRLEDLSPEFKSFFRCLRPCVLVGVDCQEQYNPHRVARQFGFDQGIPERIPKEHVSSEIGWYDYNKPLSEDEILHVPSRLFESGVSETYLKWRRNSVLYPVSPFMSMKKGPRSCRRPKKYSLSYRKNGHCANVFQDFVLKSPRDKTASNINRCEIEKPNPENDLDVPPGFEHVHAADIGSFNDLEAEARSNEVANKFVETAKEELASTESADDAPPGFGHVRAVRFRSLNDLVSEAKSNEVVDDSPPGFGRVRAGKEQFISEKSVDDAPPGFGSSTKSTVRKRKEQSLPEGFRTAPAVPQQIVVSITGADYMNTLLNKGGSVHKESERRANGSSSNVDAETVSDVEADVSRIEEEVAALKRCKRRRSGASDVQARVDLIKTRLSKIEEELSELRSDEDV